MLCMDALDLRVVVILSNCAMKKEWDYFLGTFINAEPRLAT